MRKKPETGETDCLDLPTKRSPRLYGNPIPDSSRIKEMALAMSVEAMRVVYDVMMNAKTDSTRLQAAQMVIDRGCGKVHVQMDEPAPTHTRIQVLFGTDKPSEDPEAGSA
jgi:hypothetical protein